MKTVISPTTLGKTTTLTMMTTARPVAATATVRVDAEDVAVRVDAADAEADAGVEAAAAPAAAMFSVSSPKAAQPAPKQVKFVNSSFSFPLSASLSVWGDVAEKLFSD